MPLSIPLACFFLPVIVIIALPFAITAAIINYGNELGMRREYKNAGQFMSRAERDANLAAGKGTLIVVIDSSKNIYHEWWTEDDLISKTPMEFSDDLGAGCPHEQKSFAGKCLTNQTGITHGTAHLVKGFSSLGRVPDMTRFPLAKIVTIIVENDIPLIAKGYLTKFDTQDDFSYIDVTERRCPKCDNLCPKYRKTCRICGHKIGRDYA